MPLLTATQSGLTGTPSTLADVLRAVRDMLSEAADGTPVLVGRAYLRAGVGSGPRVLFVPDIGGRLGPASEMGMVASATHGCEVFVRADERAEDFDRLTLVYALADRVVSAIARAGAGRVTWETYADGSPTDTDAFGAELALRFTFSRDIPHSQTLLAVASAANGSAEPFPSGGQPGTASANPPTLTITVTPTEG